MTDTSFNYEEVAGSKTPLKMWTKGVPVEAEAMAQLRNIAKMPFVHRHVAVMPDVHLGKGATVGSVIPTKGAIIPAAVGVDIGCGMMAHMTSLTAADLPDNLSALRSAIEAQIPHGRTDNGGVNDRGAWGEPSDLVKDILGSPVVQRSEMPTLQSRLNEIVEKHPKLGRSAQRVANHLGTLGTGNHFVELCLDQENRVWIMLHSGSRGIGNAIGQYFIDLAKQDMRKWFINLPDADLAYLPEGTEHFDDYIRAMLWAQDYAIANREFMMTAAKVAIQKTLGRTVFSELVAVNCHHNYASEEKHYGDKVWVTRKGAVSARAGQLGIIPGSMGARSFIVRGLGNRESFYSCSHGAGRRMSRGEAKRTFTLKDHIEATSHVECRKDKDVIDETPMAYKDIDAVIAAQSDLIQVEHTLRQVLCVKG